MAKQRDIARAKFAVTAYRSWLNGISRRVGKDLKDNIQDIVNGLDRSLPRIREGMDEGDVDVIELTVQHPSGMSDKDEALWNVMYNKALAVSRVLDKAV